MKRHISNGSRKLGSGSCQMVPLSVIGEWAFTAAITYWGKEEFRKAYDEAAAPTDEASEFHMSLMAYTGQKFSNTCSQALPGWMRDSPHLMAFPCDRSLMKCILRVKHHTSLRTRLCEAVAYVFWCKLDLQDIISEVEKCPRFAEEVLLERMRKSKLGENEVARGISSQARDVGDVARNIFCGNITRSIEKSLWEPTGFMGFDLSDEPTLRKQWAGQGFYRSIFASLQQKAIHAAPQEFTTLSAHGKPTVFHQVALLGFFRNLLKTSSALTEEQVYDYMDTLLSVSYISPHDVAGGNRKFPRPMFWYAVKRILEMVEPPRAVRGYGHRAYLSSVGFMGGGTDPDGQGVGSGSLSRLHVLEYFKWIGHNHIKFDEAFNRAALPVGLRCHMLGPGSHENSKCEYRKREARNKRRKIVLVDMTPDAAKEFKDLCATCV